MQGVDEHTFSDLAFLMGGWGEQRAKSRIDTGEKAKLKNDYVRGGDGHILACMNAPLKQDWPNTPSLVESETRLVAVLDATTCGLRKILAPTPPL